MATITQNSREYFKSTKIIFISLLAGQIIFALITLYLNLGMEPFQEDEFLRDIFLIVAPILALNEFFTGNIIYKSKLKKIVRLPNLKEKMVAYRGAFIIRLAMLEGATLFSIIIYLITADLIFIGLVVLLIACFIFLNPTKEKIISDLELNSSEISLIEDPNETIAEFENK